MPPFMPPMEYAAIASRLLRAHCLHPVRLSSPAQSDLALTVGTTAAGALTHEIP
jgi:hypothetical protein